MGAEEVEWVGEEEELLQFTTSPLDLALVREALAGLSYTIHQVLHLHLHLHLHLQASVVYLPLTTVALAPLEQAALDRLVAGLEELDIVIAVHHNAA